MKIEDFFPITHNQDKLNIMNLGKINLGGSKLGGLSAPNLASSDSGERSSLKLGRLGDTQSRVSGLSASNVSSSLGSLKPKNLSLGSNTSDPKPSSINSDIVKDIDRIVTNGIKQLTVSESATTKSIEDVNNTLKGSHEDFNVFAKHIWELFGVMNNNLNRIAESIEKVKAQPSENNVTDVTIDNDAVIIIGKNDIIRERVVQLAKQEDIKVYQHEDVADLIAKGISDTHEDNVNVVEEMYDEE